MECPCQRSLFPSRYALTDANPGSASKMASQTFLSRCFLNAWHSHPAELFCKRVTVAFTQARVLCTFKALLQLADLLYPPAFSSRPPGIPAAHFRFASCQLIEAAVFLASYFLAFEFLPPGPGHPNFATCLRTSNNPWFTEPPRSGFYSYYQPWQRVKHVMLLASIPRCSAAATDAPDLFPLILFEAHAHESDVMETARTSWMIWIVEQEHFRRF